MLVPLWCEHQGAPRRLAQRAQQQWSPHILAKRMLRPRYGTSFYAGSGPHSAPLDRRARLVQATTQRCKRNGVRYATQENLSHAKSAIPTQLIEALPPRYLAAGRGRATNRSVFTCSPKTCYPRQPSDSTNMCSSAVQSTVSSRQQCADLDIIHAIRLHFYIYSCLSCTSYAQPKSPGHSMTTEVPWRQHCHHTSDIPAHIHASHIFGHNSPQ